MLRRWQLSLLPVSIGLLAAGEQSWKDKRVAGWSEDDARQVLTDSPWAKTVTATVNRSGNNGQRRSGGGMGRRDGMGGPGTGGGGYPPGGQPGGTRDGAGANSTEPPALKLRWESALPVREAELKTRDTSAPTLDDNHYAIAVYGVPRRMANADSQRLAAQLKKQAAIKRDGKKDLKPSSVVVLQREEGLVIVYLFSRSAEITRQDKRIEFEAEIGRLKFAQSFYVDDMTYQGKLEL